MLDPKEVLFAHEEIRESQQKLVEDVNNAIIHGSHLIAHAPTGLGKTAATLAPAISFALRNAKHVMFLTSRHTQHQIAIKTIRKMVQTHGVAITATSIVGKKWMCLHEGVERLSSSEFSEYCKAQREDNRCEFYTNTRKNDNQKTLKAGQVLDRLIKISPVDSEKTKKVCEQDKVCPYEMGLLLAENARAIVADYYYIFNPSVSDKFLKKADIDLKDTIIIVDEGHNLPARVRELLTSQMSDVGLDIAIKEAQKYELEDTLFIELKAALEKIGQRVPQDEEILVRKEQVVDAVKGICDYEELVRKCSDFEDIVLDHQKRSAIGQVGEFLERWTGPDEGYARILQRKETHRGAVLQLSYRCLDPSIITEPIIKKSHSTILMSGTLTPTSMYRDLMRFPVNTKECEYPSPFDKSNRMSIIVPKTTTKYSSRSDEQFKNIAKVCLDIIEGVPGNTAIFFPSYFILKQVKRTLDTATTRTVFAEDSRLTKQEREGVLEAFKGYKDTGAILLGVSSGSFGEGIDLPGEYLKAVIVVGVPLGRPDLETKQLINYYDKKFRKGWDYGYTLPAITKVLQNAGRCIRTETDRGLIAFVDERYAWPRYMGCFPKSWNLKIKAECQKTVREFFDESEAVQ